VNIEIQETVGIL
jgi:hypothetical protein